MKSSRPKRRRLTYVSSRPRPDLPATFESLNDDTLTTVLEFVGDKSYQSFGGLNYHCKEIYLLSGMKKETFLYGYGSLSVIQNRYDNSFSAGEAVAKGVVFHNRRDVLDWALQERKKLLWNPISYLAAKEGRIDILDEIWNNIDENDKISIFGGVDYDAAGGGKLHVLKWVEMKGFHIDEMSCAGEAAYRGHLHILKWLHEKNDFILDGDLYLNAICGGHLHLMKWIREQNVPWVKETFKYAADTGNLEILQWLHNEGCPWPEDDDLRVLESQVKPEALAWLRANGYGNKIW